jgi:hypothetical protein
VKSRRKGRRSGRGLRAFLTALVCTLCAIALACGVLIVDSRSRRIGFDDGKTLISQITGKNISLSCIDDKICYNYFVLEPSGGE